MEIQFRILTEQELPSILPLVELLNPRLSPELLRERLQEMAGQGYECVGGYHGERLIAICGLWITTRFYCGKQIEPDNVIVHPDYRDQQIGQSLMHWVYEYGKSQGCLVSGLACYVTNHAAHRFYLRERYDILGYHFHKEL